MKTLKRNLKSWREGKNWKGISREWKIRLVGGLIILFLFLAAVSILSSGCAFTHRGETSVGLFKDVKGTTDGSSTVSIKRPSRD